MWLQKKSEVIYLVQEISVEHHYKNSEVKYLFEYKNYSSLNKIFNVTRLVFKFLNRINSRFIFPEPSVYLLKISQFSHFNEIYTFLVGKSNIE